MGTSVCALIYLVWRRVAIGWLPVPRVLQAPGSVEHAQANWITACVLAVGGLTRLGVRARATL